MGLRSSKQKSADITGSPSEKKSKKKGKKESINGDAGTEATNQENGESVEKSLEAESDDKTKTEEDVTSRNIQAEPANVDEDSATGSGGVTAPASPDTLQGVSDEGKLKQDEELATEKAAEETLKDEVSVQKTDEVKEESKPEESEKKPEETVEKQEPPTNGISTTFKWEKGGKEVELLGSFGEWKDSLPLSEKDGIFYLTSNLAAGDHYYKFKVDGEWAVDQNQPTTELEGQGTVNIMTVSAKE